MAAIKCLKCNEVLESLYRHDFVQCSCSNESFVDGGTDYTRIGGMNIDQIEVLLSCEECGCRLDNKEDIVYVYNNKAINICRQCYTRLKEID